ncbi:MAG: 5-(carboxyamino)imidazole ribonucleotide mutase [Sedimentisphaerales bacterium]|nr:5-(carboxyamino)imidazole ribonucleotide mutase [Sedimentisphaerales bacterium]
MAEDVNAKIIMAMGSDSDWPVMEAGVEILREFGLACEVYITSAHRTPEETVALAQNARERGIRVIIAAAGLAAHLAGVIAAHTTLPVIGIPLAGGPLQGVDALLSTVQMPPGIPVATVGIGSAGAKNAALLAIQILALNDQKLAERLRDYKAGMAEKVKQKNQKLQRELDK